MVRTMTNVGLPMLTITTMMSRCCIAASSEPILALQTNQGDLTPCGSQGIMLWKDKANEFEDFIKETLALKCIKDEALYQKGEIRACIKMDCHAHLMRTQNPDYADVANKIDEMPDLLFAKAKEVLATHDVFKRYECHMAKDVRNFFAYDRLIWYMSNPLKTDDRGPHGCHWHGDGGNHHYRMIFNLENGEGGEFIASDGDTGSGILDRHGVPEQKEVLVKNINPGDILFIPSSHFVRSHEHMFWSQNAIHKVNPVTGGDRLRYLLDLVFTVKEGYVPCECAAPRICEDCLGSKFRKVKDGEELPINEGPCADIDCKGCAECFIAHYRDIGTGARRFNNRDNFVAEKIYRNMTEDQREAARNDLGEYVDASRDSMARMKFSREFDRQTAAAPHVIQLLSRYSGKPIYHEKLTNLTVKNPKTDETNAAIRSRFAQSESGGLTKFENGTVYRFSPRFELTKIFVDLLEGKEHLPEDLITNDGSADTDDGIEIDDIDTLQVGALPNIPESPHGRAGSSK